MFLLLILAFVYVASCPSRLSRGMVVVGLTQKMYTGKALDASAVLVACVVLHRSAVLYHKMISHFHSMQPDMSLQMQIVMILLPQMLR